MSRWSPRSRVRLPWVVRLVVALSGLVIPTMAHGQYTHLLDGSGLPGGNGWVVDGDPGVIVDLGGGNSGIQQTDDTAGAGGGAHGGSYDEYYVQHTNPDSSLNARFRLDSHTFNAGDPARQTLFALTPRAAGGAPSVGLRIRDVGGVPHWVAVQFLGENTDPSTGLLADLGPVTTGVFNDVGLYANGTTDTLRVFWNGSEVYNGPGALDWSGDDGYAEVGASNYWGEGGTSSVTFDWVGYGPGFIPVPEPSAATALCVMTALTALGRRRGV